MTTNIKHDREWCRRYLESFVAKAREFEDAIPQLVALSARLALNRAVELRYHDIHEEYSQRFRDVGLIE